MPKSKNTRRTRTQARAANTSLRKPALNTGRVQSVTRRKFRHAQTPTGGRPKLFPGRTGGR